FVRERSGQIRNQIGGGAIEDAIPMDTGLLPQGLNNVTLSNSAPTHQDQIGATPDEISGSQLFDLLAVKGLGVELPVEAFQGFVLSEVRSEERRVGKECRSRRWTDHQKKNAQ